MIKREGEREREREKIPYLKHGVEHFAAMVYYVWLYMATKARDGFWLGRYLYDYDVRFRKVEHVATK